MSVNKVILIGNVGNEPEIRYIESDVCTAQVSLATTQRGYTLQNGVQVPERTEWHTIYLWRGLAKIVENYVHKGDKIYVEGELRYRTYTDKKGINRKIAEIWANNIELLTPKPQNNEATPHTQNTPGFQPTNTPLPETNKNKLPF